MVEHRESALEGTDPEDSSGGSSEITLWLARVTEGDPEALQQVFALLYEELKRLAHGQLQRSPRSSTLATTALVHELYLKLSRNPAWSVEGRQHFYAMAARAMRQILVDRARYRSRSKRGGRLGSLESEHEEIAAPEASELVLALDRHLRNLEARSPELARLVEWRFFAGLSQSEIAEMLGVSERTVKRKWRVARAILYRELSAEGLAL